MKVSTGPPPKFFRWILSRLSIYEDMFGVSREFEIEYLQTA